MRRALLLAVAGAAAVALWDPFGLAWLGWALAGVLVLVFLLQLARSLNRRRSARTLAGLRAMAPEAFEEEVARWLRRGGWRVERRGGTGDAGIDLLATKRGETLAVQCKRYGEQVTVPAAVVRELYGAAVATEATVALLVTTGRVSRQAAEWAAAREGRPRVVVIDGDGVAQAAMRGRLTL
ncbi:restriction endonuclease [Tepidiforma sp.]|uniref:restriction endonuclease n=1 Tax=Tepidiforma sp. TaxID=2682230 RepID=UPI002ADE729A|nr:restriction endonuclease [Tepidiforma sp.]